jgi:hypothetical protein
MTSEITADGGYPGDMVPEIVEFREGCREPRPARSAGPASPRSSAGWRRPTEQALADTPEEGARVETIINDYISRELVQDPALLPLNFASVNTICARLRAREPGNREEAAARG